MVAAATAGPWASVDVQLLLQALGWACVLWLLAVDGLVRRGRLPAGSRAFRMAGCAAAVCVVVASSAERLWPVAVLGLLWLRTEVFGYRQSPAPVPVRAAREYAPVFVPGFGPYDAGGAAHDGGIEDDGGPVPRHPLRDRLPHPHLPHPRLPHVSAPHLPHPHLTRRFVNMMFRIEMTIVVSVVFVVFLVWAQQQREAVGHEANHTLCHWLTQC